MYKKSISQMSHDLQEGLYSSVELVETFLNRIKQYDPQLNAFITITEASALVAARHADKQRAQGDTRPLLGIPIAHKDIFCTRGIKTSCASKMLDNFIAPYDATVVNHYQEAGCILLGKTNMDEFAMGSSNETSFYGPTKNPWDLTRVPGGSSGGSASAVAARLIPAATGTDTGGSIRQPAALCGISGLKPTYGRVSRYGMIAYASSLDQGGPFANSVEDLALLMQVMAGFDPKDSTCVEREVPDYSAALNNSMQGLKIGLPKEYFSHDLDPATQKIIQQTLQDYEKLGAKLVDISLPNSHLAIPAYYIIAPAECSSNLSRYDGVRYGYRCQDPKNLFDLYSRSRGESFGDEVKRRIMVGTYALSAGYYDAYYLKAQKIRHLIQQDFVHAFKEIDVIASPTAPTTAFKLGEKINDPITMYQCDIFTLAVNLAGLPALAIPAGFSQNLPVGLQLIGNYFNEEQLLTLGHHYQQVTDWHTQMPSAFAK